MSNNHIMRHHSCGLMDSIAIFLFLSFIIYTLFLLPAWRRRRSKLPPGPAPLPIIGNILLLGQSPHRRLAEISKSYGPLMYLKLGSIHTVVASSPETAKQILQKHDQVCSGRAVPHTAHATNHHEASIAWLSAGQKWRRLRKITREHMFTAHEMELSGNLRRDKIRRLRGYLNECCSGDAVVNFEEVSFVTSLNLMSATLFSTEFARFGSESTRSEMKEYIQGLMKIAGTPNVADFFPILRRVDPQGLFRKSESYLSKILEEFDEIVVKRLQERKENLRKNDLLEGLLDLNQENPNDFSLHDIKHLLLDLFVAGTDTTTDSVQWAMAELLRNPDKLSIAKNELTAVIGANEQVQESDIAKLPYLNAAIKESFRLHPPGPFLIPHKAESDVEINGYFIPRGARILVNVWAIGRDPKTWSDPDSFEPQRFLDRKIDYRGKDFELIPFSSGRRICPGLPLAHLMVHLMVATMIHSFDWKLEKEEVDMDDVFGLSLHKAEPLKAYPIRR